MICPSCGMRNNYFHRYCFNCGTRLINDEVTDEALQLSDKDQYFMEEELLFTEEEQLYSNTSSFVTEDEYEEVADSIVEDSSDADESDIVYSRDYNDTNDLGDFTDTESSADSIPWDESKDEESEEQANLYTGNFEDIFPDLDFYFKEEDDTEFDIQTQLPLRRYRGSKKSTSGLQQVLKAFITIILISLVGLFVYIGYVELFQKPSVDNSIAKSIDLGYQVEEINLDDQTARRIIIMSTIGEQVKVKDKVAAIIGGQAEIILPDSEFALDEFEQKDGLLQVSLPVTVLADGYPNRTEEIYFEVPIQKAPLKLISPSKKEAIIDGTIYQLIFEVLPGSNVFVNDNNYSHLVDDEGKLSLQLHIPEQSDEVQYEIRVSAKGYGDMVEHVVFKRKQMEFPLTIDQDVPITASNDTWVEITGNTHPEAVLSTNLEVREDITVDPDSGDFKLFVKAPANGYTPFILTAKLEDKEDSVLETVILRPVNEHDYTRSAWALDYSSLRAYPDLHNGIPFVFTGAISDIQSTGAKTTLLINVAAQGQPEQLVYVEYWGAVNASIGQRLRIFGNRWGNKEDYPYILASYIYN